MEDQLTTVLKKLLVHVKASILRGPTAYLPIEDWEGGDRNSFLKTFPLFKLKITNKEQREGVAHVLLLQSSERLYLLSLTLCVCVCVCVCVCLLVTQLCLTLCDPWTVSSQAPLSMGFSRQEYWSGVPFLSSGNLSNPGIKPGSLHLLC